MPDVPSFNVPRYQSSSTLIMSKISSPLANLSSSSASGTKGNFAMAAGIFVPLCSDPTAAASGLAGSGGTDRLGGSGACLFGGDEDDIEAAAEDTADEAAAAPVARPLAAVFPAEVRRSFMCDVDMLPAKDLRSGGTLFDVAGGPAGFGVIAGRSGTDGMGRFDIVLGDGIATVPDAMAAAAATPASTPRAMTPRW